MRRHCEGGEKNLSSKLLPHFVKSPLMLVHKVLLVLALQVSQLRVVLLLQPGFGFLSSSLHSHACCLTIPAHVSRAALSSYKAKCLKCTP
jgi:hypothetical protein